MDFEYSLILGNFFNCIWLECTQIYINYIYLKIYLFIYSLKKGLHLVLVDFSSAILQFETFRVMDFFQVVFEQFRAVLQNSSLAFSS